MSITSWVERIGYYDKGQSQKVRALLFGDTGTGKTRLSGSFPSPFFLDSDRGGKTLESLHVPFLPIQREGKIFEEVMEILRTLQAGKDPFDKLVVETLVFDSVTSLADMLMIEAMRTSGKTALDPTKSKPEWDHYAIVQARLKAILKFAQDLDVNVVATCGTKLEKDDIRGTFVGKPNIIGGYRDLISYDFDDVVFMTCEGTQAARKYLAYTGRVSYYEAKSRSGLAFKVEDPSYAKMWGAKQQEVFLSPNVPT
jgi:hypothetical protein